MRPTRSLLGCTLRGRSLAKDLNIQDAVWGGVGREGRSAVLSMLLGSLLVIPVSAALELPRVSVLDPGLKVQQLSLVTFATGTYTPHPPILIRGDAMFSLPSSGVVSGTGTAQDPYVIEGWELSPLNIHSHNGAIDDGVGSDCHSSPAITPNTSRLIRLHAIEIKDTTKYVTIRSNYIHAINPVAVADSNFLIGIFLENAPHVKIESNIIGSAAGPALYRGVCTRSSSNLAINGNTLLRAINAQIQLFEGSNLVTISGNTVQFGGQGSDGIVAFETTNLFVTGNTVSNQGRRGISLVGTHGVVVEKNLVEESGLEALEVSGNDALIRKNIVRGNSVVGISIVGSQNVLVNENNIHGNGLDGMRGLNFYINAENNYWGCSDGPGAAECDSAVGVDFTPWRTSPVPDAGVQP